VAPKEPSKNDSLALIAYAIASRLPPMKGIRFSNAPRLSRSGVNRFEGRTDAISGRFALQISTVHFNPIHGLPRLHQIDRPLTQLGFFNYRDAAWPQATSVVFPA
jgi:hypothetical protein